MTQLTKRDAARFPAPPTCCHCGLPLRAGEPHWAGDAENRPWHYSCAERARLTMSWTRVRHRRAMVAGA